MHLEKILKEESFTEIYQIMEQSFPKCEIRTYEKAIKLLNNPRYYIYAARKEDRSICGFISSWHFEKFIFVEHFAVLNDMRGGGIGSRMMREYLGQNKLPVYLEVEAADTAITKRRISFYQRLGFILTDFGYIQPNLQKSDQKVFLNIMGYPYGPTKSEFDKFKEVLFSQVYGCINAGRKNAYGTKL